MRLFSVGDLTPRRGVQVFRMIEGLYGVRGPASERVRELSLLGAVGSSARLAKDIGGRGGRPRSEGRGAIV